MPRLTTKLFFALLYLGILLFISGKIIHQMGKFTGFVVLDPGQNEKWTLRESTKEGILATALRNMPLDLVGLNHAGTASRFFNRQKQFDAVQLPFSLTLEQPKSPVQIKEKHHLEISSGEERNVRSVIPGQRVECFDTTIDIVSLQPWSGLIREERGSPGLVMNLEHAQNAASHKLFFEDATLLRPEEGLSIQWHWVADEDEARQRIENFNPGKSRWGIREAGRIHWFESFTPGDGLIASDGREYTLIDLEESDNSAVIGIAVEIKDDKTTHRAHASPEDHEPDDDVLFEAGVEGKHLLCLSWREGAALLALFEEGRMTLSQLLEEEESIALNLSDEKTLYCTLSQVMEKSVPLPLDQSPFKELTVQAGDERIALRNGESRPLGALRFAYRYTKTIPPARHRFQASFLEQENTRSFLLAGTRKVRIDSWKLSLESDPADGTILPVVVRAERMLGTPSQLAGLGICFLGIIGLTVFRFADWRQDRKEDHSYGEHSLD